jgi:hypothetical protein
MTNFSPQDQNTETQSLPVSLPKKTKSESNKEPVTSPLKNGLETSETSQKNSLASGSANSLSRRGKMPVPKLRAKQDRTKEALVRLGVKPEDLATCPQITPLLKHADGGLKAVLGAMRFAADDPDIGPFLEKYDSIPAGDRERLPWEAVALSADINIKHLLGAIQLAAQAHSVNTVKLIAVTSHPKITKARVRFGQLPSGERNRTALDTAMGFLPTAKGPTFIGKAVFGSSSSVGNSSSDEDSGTPMGEDEIIDQLFPSVVGIQEKLIPIRQKLLEEPKKK